MVVSVSQAFFLALPLTVLFAGCAGSDSAPGSPVATVTDGGVTIRDVAGLSPDYLALPAPPMCALGGTGRLRVTVSLDPTLDRFRADIWLAARCGEGAQDRTVRVLRWNRELNQTFDALGPGSYQIYASSFLSPGSWSSRVTLGGGTTAAVPVTLQGGVAAIVTLRTGGLSPNAPSVDLAGVYVSTIEINAVSSPSPVGHLEVSATPGPDGLSVQCLVRNTCSAPPCSIINIQGVEVRALERDIPGDIRAERFDTRSALPGDTSTLRPVLVRAPAPDGTHALEVALYGSLSLAPRPSP